MRFKHQARVLALSLALITLGQVSSYAATSTDDIDAQIAEQQRILDELSAKRDQKKNDALSNQISSLQKELEQVKADSQKGGYDAQGAIEALMGHIDNLQKEIDSQGAAQDRLAGALDKLEKLLDDKNKQSAKPAAQAVNYTASVLVNPGPSTVSYTQDAKNAQGNSTVTFVYAPNQLYKIYCRAGYLTDITLKKGEKINFVGGGDTSGWAVNSASVDGVAHLYIKPATQTGAPSTNLIITTDKRSYQLLLTASDWYNPMVTWSYADDEKAMTQGIERSTIGQLSASSADSLHFNYKVSGKGDDSLKPTTVFDDGEKVFLKFSRMPKTLPALFVKERGHRNLSLVNFVTKGDCYVIDRLFDRAELRFGDQDIVTIEHKN